MYCSKSCKNQSYHKNNLSRIKLFSILVHVKRTGYCGNQQELFLLVLLFKFYLLSENLSGCLFNMSKVLRYNYASRLPGFEKYFRVFCELGFFRTQVHSRDNQ